MGPKEELRILEGLLKTIDAPKRKGRNLRHCLTNIVLWLAVATILFAVFRDAESLEWPHYLLAGCCFSLGGHFACDIYKSLHSRQWPLMSGYFDKDQARRRIAELRT